MTGMAPAAASHPARIALTLMGLAGATGILLFTASLSGTSPVLYQGGFLVSALCAAALIAGPPDDPAVDPVRMMAPPSGMIGAACFTTK